VGKPPQAIPKDGRVVLRWDDPADGACVSTFVVNVIDPLFRRDMPAQVGGRVSSGFPLGGLTVWVWTCTAECASEPGAYWGGFPALTGSGWRWDTSWAVLTCVAVPTPSVSV
jgi:hypothetical protein